MINVQHVRQKGKFDCGPACLSMITGIPLNEVIRTLDDYFDPSTGIGIHFSDVWLAENGFAVSRLYRFRGEDKVNPWPPEPWADVHFMQIRVGRGWHFVVWLRDGTILDPYIAEPLTLETMPHLEISNIAGVHRFSPWPRK